MNILMALSQLEVTGAEAFATTLADKLIGLGYRIVIVSDTLTLPTKAAFTPIPFNKRRLPQRIRNIRAMIRLVREHRIHAIHAHSRAAGWCAYFAAWWCNVPLITTVHGRQPTHFSRKVFHAFGDKVLPICEAIRENLVAELGVQSNMVEVLRNGVAEPIVNKSSADALRTEKPLITLLGRLSKEKGELAYRIVQELMPLLGKNIHLRVVGGDKNGIPTRFNHFRPKVEFTGFVSNVPDYLAASDVVIGAGRSAIEALLLEKPTIAVGEARLHGLLTPETFADALFTNFGDIAAKQDFHGDFCRKSVEDALHLVASKEPRAAQQLKNRTAEEFSIERLLHRMDAIYQRTWSKKRRYEVPILTYHRIVRNKAEGGSLPIWVTESQFEEHLQILKHGGFTTLTVNDLAALPTLGERFNPDWKPILLTFDDGYEDNYSLLFPILQRYGFTATIFLVAGMTHNDWDKGIPGAERLPLLNIAQIQEMQRYGIDFGSHSMTHPRLASLDLLQAQAEISTSKHILEDRLGQAVMSFCYPYGSLSPDVKRLVGDSGYQFGIASDSGSAFLHEDLLEVRRIGVFPNTNARGFRRKITGGYVFQNQAVKNALRH
ncbi:MAG: polysaccharide deacetylase family protein [Candidatus Kapaibacteriota bacterium]